MDSGIDPLFIGGVFFVIAGKTPLSFEKNYYFTEEEAEALKERYEEKLKKEIQAEIDPVKIAQFKYLLRTLRVEKVVLH